LQKFVIVQRQSVYVASSEDQSVLAALADIFDIINKTYIGLQCTFKILLNVTILYVVFICSRKATFSTFLNCINFILFQLNFVGFKPKIKFIKYLLHNYDLW